MGKFILFYVLIALTFWEAKSTGIDCADRIVGGYIPNYRNINTMNLDGLTHAFYAFAKVQEDGSIAAESQWNQTKVSTFITTCNNKSIAKFVSFGTPNFTKMTKTESNIAKFADTARKYCEHHGFDGVDIDWEALSTNEETINHEKLMKYLADTLHKYNLKLVVTVGANEWGGKWFSNKAVLYADWMQIMVYDNKGTWPQSPLGNHSSFQDVINSENYWVDRGINRNFLVLGLPFYGYKFKDNSGGLASAVTYSTISSQYLQMDSCSNQTPCENLTYFNGPNLIRKKVNYAIRNSFKGVFIWEMGQDAPGEKSMMIRVKDEFAKACNNENIELCANDIEPCVLALENSYNNQFNNDIFIYNNYQKRLSVQVPYQGEGQIFIFNSTGQAIFHNTVYSNANIPSEVNVKLNPSELYIIQYISNGFSTSKKLVFN